MPITVFFFTSGFIRAEKREKAFFDRFLTASRSIGESERESSDAYTQELSLGNITADHEAVMSPVAPTNLDFNTYTIVDSL